VAAVCCLVALAGLVDRRSAAAPQPRPPVISDDPAARMRSDADEQAAERRFDEWQFAEGRQLLAKVKAKRPDAPETHYLEGYARFLGGDYHGAVERLKKAQEAVPADLTVAELLALSKAAEDAIREHKPAHSAHFSVLYPPEDAVLVPYALETLEAAYSALHDDLGFTVEEPVRVEFYRSPSDLAAVSSLSEAEVARTGTIALCKWARLMVTTPRALAYGYPWLDSINHELVHYAVSTLSHDHAPVWLQEGLAKFLERRWREPAGGRLAPTMEHLLAKALKTGKLIGFEAMHPSMAKLPSAEDATLAFGEVATTIAYLHSVGGMPALRAAIEKVGAGADAREAVASSATMTWPEFEKGWKGFLAAQHFKTFPGFDIATTHIRQESAIASRRRPNEEEALSTALKLAPPFRHLRLGNMLLLHNRQRAAIAEYEKGKAASEAPGARRPDPAQASSPTVTWLFAVKLGRAYLGIGDAQKALDAVAEVRTTYPDLPWPSLIAGQALLAQGHLPEALAALRASIATNPFDPEAHCALADAYARSGQGEGDVLARERRFCRELAGD
jgi:tetratricopeptide (TPR) repeat protein